MLASIRTSDRTMKTEFNHRFLSHPRTGSPDRVDGSESASHVEGAVGKSLSDYRTVGNSNCRALDEAPATLAFQISRQVR
jgi:hypothetical protein